MHFGGSGLCAYCVASTSVACALPTSPLNARAPPPHHPPPLTHPHRRANLSEEVQSWAEEVALDEQGHVRMIRQVRQLSSHGCYAAQSR